MCLLAQGVLLVVCATSFAWLATEEDRVKEKQEIEQETYAALPTEDEGELTLNVPTDPDALHEDETQNEKGNGESVESKAANASMDAEEKPVTNVKSVRIYKADIKRSLDERVAQLMAQTDMGKGDEAHYKRLLEGKALVWTEPYVLLRFDELAYLYWEAMKADAEKAKDGKLTAVRAKAEGERLTIDFTVQFEVTNKLLRLMMGSGSQEATAHIQATVKEGAVTVQDVTVSGSKEYSDSLMRLGSDYLLGTEDYKGYVRALVAKVNASLGIPYQASDVYYGVVFCTQTA